MFGITFALHLDLRRRALEAIDQRLTEKRTQVAAIDGRMDLQKLLVLSPFDPFTTLFNLAKLQHERAITIPT